MSEVRIKLVNLVAALGTLAFAVLVLWGYLLQDRVQSVEAKIDRHLSYHLPRGAR